MTVRTAFVALALVLPVGLARAFIPPPSDTLLTAYHAAVADLCAGKDRRQIADRLKPVVEANAASVNHKFVSEFLADLTESAKHPPKPDAEPEKRLADTRITFSVLKYAENWGGPLKQSLEKDPNDPACRLLAADRAVIGRLLPLLKDRSPTRADELFGIEGRLYPQPRVCDVALSIIEYHGRCRFHHDTIYGTVLHQLPADRRETAIWRVEEWWKENKDKSVAAGVRSQLPYAGSYPEKVWMAKSLARLGEGQQTGDREFGLNVLRDMVKQNRRSHVGAYAAGALAEFGDTSAVDVFYDEWKLWLGRPGLMHDSHIAFYLCAHGKRREWELLHAISLEEIQNGGQGTGGWAVWAAVVNSPPAGTNPYAIPVLGLALRFTEPTGNRYVEGVVGGQSFSKADTATECLQKQVGKVSGTGTPGRRRSGGRRSARPNSGGTQRGRRSTRSTSLRKTSRR
jgi:hypothetical protein